MQISDEDVRLLVYYLAQEVPGEVSFKKLYLAFTQTDRDIPLAQEGADEIQRYNSMLRDQVRRSTPMEVVELINFMKQNTLTIQSLFKNAPTSGLITVQDFETTLNNVGFKARDMPKLVEALDTQGKKISVNLLKLQELIGKIGNLNQKSSINAQLARDKY